MKRILVTGESGFIGKNLIKDLSCKIDVQLRSIDLKDFFEDRKDWEEKLLSIIEEVNPDVIFHIGACSDTLESDVNLMMQLNYQSTKILVDWAKKNTAKIIYSSSAANYGTNGRFPSNLYGWSKYAAEGYVISNGGVALRYFNVYGPGEEHKGIMSSVAYQSHQKNMKNEIVELFPGNPRRDFIYVKDVISANLHAMLEYFDLGGDWYDIGSYEARTFEDVLISIGIKKWEYKQKSAIPNGYQFFTVAKKRMPGWNPKFNLEDGLKDYIKYLTKNE